MVCWSPYLLLFGFKVCYAYIWLNNGKLRRHYLPFYRLSITYDISIWTVLIIIGLINWNGYGTLENVIQFCAIAFCLFDFTVFQVYTNYLDRVHYADMHRNRD